eukprot:2995868-Pyramimonas_sp.AAC.1
MCPSRSSRAKGRSPSTAAPSDERAHCRPPFAAPPCEPRALACGELLRLLFLLRHRAVVQAGVHQIRYRPPPPAPPGPTSPGPGPTSRWLATGVTQMRRTRRPARCGRDTNATLVGPRSERTPDPTPHTNNPGPYPT